MANEDDETNASRKRFWAEQLRRVSETDITEFKSQQLPLARIKRIMKADEDVRMISAEAPVIFAKACELFILDLTMRAWEHTKTTKRRTLQKCDVASAIEEDDMFDFLVDIVPREAPIVMPAGMTNAEYFQYQQQALQNAVLAQAQQQQQQHAAAAFQSQSDAAAAAALANQHAAAGFVQQQQAAYANSFPQATAASSSSSSAAAPSHAAAAAAAASSSSSALHAAAVAAANNASAAPLSTSSSSLAGSTHPQHDPSSSSGPPATSR